MSGSSDLIPEAMRELSSIKDQRDVVLAASIALIVAHKKARVVGKWKHTYFDKWLVNDHVSRF